MHGNTDPTHLLSFSIKFKADFQLSVVPNSRNSRQVKLLLATCSLPMVPLPDVCFVSATQAEQGGSRTLLSASHIKQHKENVCFFGKLCCFPILVKERKTMMEDLCESSFFLQRPQQNRQGKEIRCFHRFLILEETISSFNSFQKEGRNICL